MLLQKGRTNYYAKCGKSKEDKCFKLDICFFVTFKTNLLEYYFVTSSVFWIIFRIKHVISKCNLLAKTDIPRIFLKVVIEIISFFTNHSYLSYSISNQNLNFWYLKMWKIKCRVLDFVTKVLQSELSSFKNYGSNANFKLHIKFDKPKYERNLHICCNWKFKSEHQKYQSKLVKLKMFKIALLKNYF